MKILHVVGARPNFMKAVPVLRAIGAIPIFGRYWFIPASIMTTTCWSCFFENWPFLHPMSTWRWAQAPRPGRPAQIMIRFEEVVLAQRPDWVLVYGDVNSTVAVDEGRVLVVEAKNKLEKRMVNEFIEERLPRFKELFPEYARYRVQGGIGALVVKEDVGRYADKAGLYVMTQTDEGGAALLNRDDFEPKEFS